MNSPHQHSPRFSFPPAKSGDSPDLATASSRRDARAGKPGTSRLASFFATNSLCEAKPLDCSPTVAGRAVRNAAWPVALVLVIHRVLVVALNGTPTDDFTTVYSAVRRMLDGQAVYEQAYNHVDPLYLYNPGATALLSPMGLIDDFATARTLFIVCNALAVVLAMAVMTRTVGHKLDGWLWPASLAVAFSTESVTNTLAFTNINGLLLLALSLFLWAFIRGNEEKSTSLRLLAGVVIGLAIVIKPQFAPLLALAAVRLDWRAFLGGLGIPVGLNLLAVAFIPATDGYMEKLVPYLAITRDYANSSWAGVHAYFEFGDAFYWTVWLSAAFLVGATLLGLIRFSRSDFRLWALSTSGVIFVGIFFLSSLGQQYYSMWLFPLMFTAVFSASIFRSWPAWLAAVLYLAPLSWFSNLHPDAGRWMSFFGGTVGWLLLIVVAAATTAGWWRRSVQQDRAASAGGTVSSCGAARNDDV
ncbi:glycosyltransferase family 87 protein [Corynebacterium phocae]|uniref:glycosyltransferase family 87 protein n=1 Tax=Corynebacterium phocae TaxID=161895 RepID=UPI00095290EC|nr:glycosyltransferase family 87 protein [Corynebacterium phocae]